MLPLKLCGGPINFGLKSTEGNTLGSARCRAIGISSGLCVQSLCSANPGRPANCWAGVQPGATVLGVFQVPNRLSKLSALPVGSPLPPVSANSLNVSVGALNGSNAELKCA